MRRDAHARMYDNGYEPWTREQMIKVLRADTKKRGRPPTLNEWRRKARGRGRKAAIHRTERDFIVSETWLIKEFGSWNAALEAARLPTRHRGANRKSGKCLSGNHAWIPENLYTARPGQLACRLCANEAQRRRRAKAK